MFFYKKSFEPLFLRACVHLLFSSLCCVGLDLKVNDTYSLGLFSIHIFIFQSNRTRDLKKKTPFQGLSEKPAFQGFSVHLFCAHQGSDGIVYAYSNEQQFVLIEPNLSSVKIHCKDTHKSIHCRVYRLLVDAWLAIWVNLTENIKKSLYRHNIKSK